MTILFDQSMAIGQPDLDIYEATAGDISGASRLTIEFSNVLLAANSAFRFRARTAGGLVNANSNYLYGSHGWMQDNGSGDKPDPDTNGNEIDGLTSLAQLTDSPVKAAPHTVLGGILTILNSGANAFKLMHTAIGYCDDNSSRFAGEEGWVQIKTTTLTGFRLFSGANITGGRLVVRAD